ncbi:MAG: UDP-3-O-(3-hydroxymyristoyl)glucosamine N-acyltransferase [Bacteroidota bacterium]
MKSISIEKINSALEGELIGDFKQSVSAPEELELAKPGEITFIGGKKYERKWKDSKASVAVVNKDISIEPGEGRAFIKVDNASLAMIKVLQLFAPPAPHFESEIHPTAVISESAQIGNGVKIGANCYIGPEVEIKDGVTIYPNVVVLDHSVVGNHTIIWSGAIVRDYSIIGNYCILHPNCSIGADGFGFEQDPARGLVKVPQIGRVVLGDFVEIGANSCVDRAKFSETILGDGCKIDNLVQIGHNSKLGMFCIMAGNSGLAGSVTLGNGVVIGGSASIKDHVKIGDGATVGAGSGVTGDIPAGKTMLGYPAVEARNALKQWAVLKRLAQKGLS